MATHPVQRLSSRGRTLLKSFLAGPSGDFAREPYDDGGGALAIGWGHRLFHGESFSGPIDRAQADRILAQDVRSAELAVARLNLALEPHEFDALAILAFDVGGEALARWTLVRRLRDTPRYPEAIAKQWLAPEARNSRRQDALAIRRACELMIFQGAPDAAIADERARLQILAARGKL